MLVTVHDSVTDVTRSVFLDVDGRSKFREILPTIINVVAADLSGATFGVAVDGVPVDLDGEVVGSGLRDGSWVTLLGAGWNPQIRPRVSVVESATQLRVVSWLSGCGAALSTRVCTVTCVARLLEPAW